MKTKLCASGITKNNSCSSRPAGRGRYGRVDGDLFSRDTLLERPLLKAIQADRKVVLLVDEVDKSDSEFEAFLFEVLSDFRFLFLNWDYPRPPYPL